ncbi:hypothetical protein Agub_g11779, partial [Astrephomene gubernaculifera]
ELWELMHELGHGLHFLLAAAPPTAAAAGACLDAESTGAGTAPTPKLPYNAFLPHNLPLELVELPSSFLERAAGEAGVVQVLLSGCRHPVTGQSPPPDVARALARAVRCSFYSPV